MPQSLAADGERLVFSDGLQTVCADIENGAELWRVPEEPNKKQRARRKTIILYGDTVVECDGGRIVARNAADGAQRWTARGGQGAMRAEDTFIARGCVWHAVGEGIAGYDLETGQLVRRIDPTVVDSPGHHLRCYRAKATENYLITQFRGAEFISLGDEAHCQNDWVRGPCRYGIMPAEGLLYVAPNPCFCYPGAKLTGLLALAPADEKMSSQTSGDAASGAPGRLEKGPAYDDVASQAPSAETGESATAACAWPTYRHDGRRSGASGGDVPPDAIVRWNVKLGGRLTPPVAAEGRVYVADKDAHVLYALNDSTGEVLWEFAAAAPIDSPPTLDGRRVLFGCADGWVYCLRADDGALAWRFQAAPEERLIVAFNRVESAWRVHGSVLVEDGLLYCTAGRSSFLDGGIHLYALEPATGRVIHHKRIDTWSPTRADAEGKPFIPSYHMEGAHSDILVSEGGKIFLAQMVFDKELREQAAPYNMRDPENPVKAMDITGTGFTADDPDLRQGFAHFRGFHRYMEKAHPELSARYRKEHGGMNMGDRFTGRHLSATAGFLDSAWFNRTYWQYSENWPGWYHGHRGAKTGNLLVVGPERTYAVQAFPTRNRQSPLFEPGKKGYLLLADDNDTEPVLDDQTRGATKGMGYTRLEPPAWYEWVPIRIRGMVLAGDRLFVTGPPDVVDPDDPMGSFEGRMGGALRSVRKSDGTTLAEIRLEAPPVFDGLIAASGRLFVATTEGRLVCLGAETE
jgi:outer membrane protein assembly factor BamB